MILENYNFHDSTISNILYDKKTLKFYIHCANEQDLCNYYTIKMQVDEYNFRVYYFKRYPKFYKIKIRAKEIEHRNLNILFNKGKLLKIEDLFLSTYTNKITIACNVLPYSKKRGVSFKIYLDIFDFSNIEVISNSV